MTVTFRPDIRPDFDAAAWTRSPEQIAAKAQAGTIPPGWLMNGQPTEVATLAGNELRCTCPKCGSPYIATVSELLPPESVDVSIVDARLGKERDGKTAKPFTRSADATLSGLKCATPDCGYTGPATRS